MGRLEEASDGRNILLFELVLCPELARLLELRTATGLGTILVQYKNDDKILITTTTGETTTPGRLT